MIWQYTAMTEESNSGRRGGRMAHGRTGSDLGRPAGPNAYALYTITNLEMCKCMLCVAELAWFAVLRRWLDVRSGLSDVASGGLSLSEKTQLIALRDFFL